MRRSRCCFPFFANRRPRLSCDPSATPICHLRRSSPAKAASAKLTLFGGPCTVISGGHAQGAAQFGASLDEAPPGAGGGYLFEVGYVGRWSNYTSGSALFSANYIAAWQLPKSMSRALPFA